MADVVRDFLAAGLVGLVRVASTPLPPLGYGVDLVCVDDLTPRMLETSSDGTEGLAQDAYHRLTTRRGSLPDDPDYGIDVVGMLSVGLTEAELIALPTRCASELKKDDRLADVDVTASFNARTKTLTLGITLTPADASVTPFALVVTVVDGAAHLALLQ